MHYEPLSFLAAEFVDSLFSIHAGAGAFRRGYAELKDAVKITSEAIYANRGCNFIFLRRFFPGITRRPRVL